MTTLHEYKLYNCYIKIFELPIYKSKICFVKYKSLKGYQKGIDFLKDINVDTSIIDDIEWSKCYGFVDQKRSTLGTLHIVFMNVSHKDYIKYYKDTLSHEGTHLVQNICEHIGLEHHKRSANEHIAYLTGYLLNYLHSL